MNGRPAPAFGLFDVAFLEIAAVAQRAKEVLNGRDAYFQVVFLGGLIDVIECESRLLCTYNLKKLLARGGAYQFLDSFREIAHIPKLAKASPA